MAEPGTKSPAYGRMAERWGLLHDLLGGTAAMRLAGEIWLPREPREEHEQYKIRLARSLLAPGYPEAVDDLSDRPFVKPVTVEGAPEYVDVEDVTRDEQNLTDTAKEAMYWAIVHGVVHGIVDHDPIPEGQPATAATDAQRRPFFQIVTAPNVPYWRYGEDGELDEVHVLECATIDDAEVKQLKVWTRETWALYREVDKDGKKVWTPVDNGAHSLKRVPLVTAYLKRRGRMEATPPLQALADTHLAHWQSYSDYRNALRFASIGILFAAGFDQSEIEKGITIGPSRLVATTNEGGKLGYVEHSGASMGLAKGHLDTLVATMEAQGLAPLVDRVGTETATGKAIDESRSMSSMQTWIRAIEGLIVAMFRLAAEWRGEELAKDFKVEVFDDFVVPTRSGNDAQTLSDMRTAGDISRKTLIDEYRRRGILSESVTAEDEQERLDEEGLTEPPSRPSDKGKEEADDDAPTGDPAEIEVD